MAFGRDRAPVYPIGIFQPTLARLVAVLSRLGIRFHLTGGITAVAYGEPHMTQDLDRILAEPEALA